MKRVDARDAIVWVATNPLSGFQILLLLPGKRLKVFKKFLNKKDCLIVFILCSAMEALEDYKLLMQQPEPDLLQGAVLIARHRHPMVEYEQIKDIVDDLAEQIKPRLPKSRYPLKMVHAISEYLYQNRKFRGNQEEFYDPDNSCINCVLERRVGIPLTLSLLYMEVATRCEFSLHGVNVPGHFLLTPADPDLEFFIDAFDGGRVAFIEDAAVTLEKIYGRKIKLDPKFLHRTEQIPARIFFTRMLNNLKAIYALQKDYAAALQVSNYLRATRPGDVDEVREHGFILWHLKRYNECQNALREYLERAPRDDKDVAKVRKLLSVLQTGSDIDKGDELT